MTKTNIKVDWEIRGVPFWLIRDYLLELGGQEQKPGFVKGVGWSVSLDQMADYQVGSICIGQVRVILDAEPDVFDSIRRALEKKLIRAGG